MLLFLHPSHCILLTWSQCHNCQHAMHAGLQHASPTDRSLWGQEESYIHSQILGCFFCEATKRIKMLQCCNVQNKSSRDTIWHACHATSTWSRFAWLWRWRQWRREPLKDANKDQALYETATNNTPIGRNWQANIGKSQPYSAKGPQNKS